MASSLLLRSGANPPSSPTAVEYPRFLSTVLRWWNVSTPILNPSENVSAPTGITMNSCRSTELSAWRPPLMMFIIGTGSRRAFAPPR